MACRRLLRRSLPSSADGGDVARVDRVTDAHQESPLTVNLTPPAVYATAWVSPLVERTAPLPLDCAAKLQPVPADNA